MRVKVRKDRRDFKRHLVACRKQRHGFGLRDLDAIRNPAPSNKPTFASSDRVGGWSKVNRLCFISPREWEPPVEEPVQSPAALPLEQYEHCA